MKDESELVRRSIAGDHEAFGCLVEAHWARLVRVARSVTGDADAEDAVQDGLLRAWRKLSQLSKPEAFGSWVARIVLRVCLRRARSPMARLDSLDQVSEPRASPKPEAAIDVGRMLGSLPPRQRAVMHLTVVEGLTDGEIAPLLGITASSVRAHRHRARQGLERSLAQRSAE
jgi:RNA polymerase sigma-70 factor (ECF subfamily)